ncbi:MAG TPA: RDD family protein [Candidatus Acidoferrales bacterium]|nr:RDD family protein [Candidatus Acidoferrales bacterium]
MVVQHSGRVEAPRPVSGRQLRHAFYPGMTRLTLGLVRGREPGLFLGPLALLRFGPPELSAHSCGFPIEGGLLAAAPGGRLLFSWQEGCLTSTVEGYRPRLPGPLYRLAQQPFHQALTRLHLLRVRGRAPAPGMPATPARRLAAAAVDVALCAAVGRLARRRFLPAFAGALAGYHLAGWTAAGQTLGGLLFGLRVVAVDGSPLTPAQALVRLFGGDTAAATEVVEA